MLALLEEVLQSGAASGYRLTRFVAHMEWALLDKPGVDDLVEFETRVNYVLPNYDDPVICTYDLSKFSAGVVMDIMRTHPVVIIGGVLHCHAIIVRSRASRVRSQAKWLSAVTRTSNLPALAAVLTSAMPCTTDY
jgi:hypothetical protein